MVTIEFYWGDLTEKKQKEILELVGDNIELNEEE